MEAGKRCHLVSWQRPMNKMISMRKILLIAAFVSAFALVIVGCTPHAQIVALGASNFAGQGVSSSDAFPAQLERMLVAKGYNVRVANAGISGDTNEGMLSRLDWAVPDGTKIVILDVSGGTFNARGKHLGDQATELAKIMDRLSNRHIQIIPLSARSIEQKQADGIHLTVEGHTIAATQLPSVIQALPH